MPSPTPSPDAENDLGAEYDYVIVGAGSAGCVLADRLTEAGDASVLVLEAGGPDRDPLIHIPIGLGRMHAQRRHDWGYDTEPEPGLGGRHIEAMRGKVLGGSSAINFMGYVRGNAGDYDRWAAAGLDGWSYAQVLPYFRRAESWELGANPYRGGDGPLPVSFSRAEDPIFDAFIASGAAIGIGATEDYNGARQEGIGRAQSNIHKGRRQSGANTYLARARRRPNLRLVMQAQATRILMQGTRAAGIAYRRHGRDFEVRAAREVILAGGVFNSPQLLMLSGIGPAAHLRSHGIDPLIDLPGVGANLQDHLVVSNSITRPAGSPFRAEMRADRIALSMVRAHLFGAGPATVLPNRLHGFVKTAPGLAVPDIQMIFRAISIAAHPWFPGIRKPYQDNFGVRPVLLHPKSRGRVELRSADPFAPVRIYSNFLAAPEDLATLRRGVRMGQELLAQRPLDPFRGEETAPGKARETDQALDAWIRASAITVHHPAGSCAMGTAPNDEGIAPVLDGALRVRGAEALRVVDASAMPDMVSGNINACVVMIAEKAADLITGRPAPPPADLPA